MITTLLLAAALTGQATLAGDQPNQVYKEHEIIVITANPGEISEGVDPVFIWTVVNAPSRKASIDYVECHTNPDTRTQEIHATATAARGYEVKCKILLIDYDNRRTIQRDVRMKFNVVEQDDNGPPDDDEDEDEDEDEDDDDNRPVPEPVDIPEDQFDNVGQRAYTWANEMLTDDISSDKLVKAAEFMENIADRLNGTDPVIVSLRTAARLITSAPDEAGITGNALNEYRAWEKRTQDVWREHQQKMDRPGITLFFRQLARALKAAAATT